MTRGEENTGGLPQGNPPEPPQPCLFSLPLGHAIFKLTYLSNHDYKHLYFESDAATVNEIVLKVSVPSWPRPGVCRTGSPPALHEAPGPVLQGHCTAYGPPGW